MKKLEISSQILVDLYNKGLSCQKIGNMLNISESYVSKKLKILNIIKRSNSIYRKTMMFNEKFFEIIDTEEKAYWLGFLYADGCVHMRKNSKIISLQVTDKEIIENFILSINGNFKYKQYKNIYACHLTSEKMFDDLINLGCIQRKSFPNETQLPKELEHHFIRGYFDGDGSVYTLTPKNYNNTNIIYKSIGISILGTKEFITELNNKLPEKLTISKEKRITTNVYYIRTQGTNKILKIYNYLYYNSSIYLTRKKLKFENYYKKDVQRL